MNPSLIFLAILSHQQLLFRQISLDSFDTKSCKLFAPISEMIYGCLLKMNIRDDDVIRKCQSN